MQSMNFTMDEKTTWQTCVLNNAKLKSRLTGFPTKLYFANLVLLCAVNVILTVSTTFLNTITILVCLKSKNLRKTKSYFLIGLLSLNDLTIGVLGSPSFVAITIKKLMGDYECTAFILFELTSRGLISMSFITLFLLNLERYVAIAYPFFHRTEVTRLRIFGTALVLWSLAILITFLQLVLNAMTKYVRISTILAFIISQAFIYISIFRNQRKTVQQCYNTSRHRNWAARKSRDFKLAKSCSIVWCCSIMCFIPITVTSFLTPHSSVIVYATSLWSGTFVLAASSINSIIFFWRNRTLRQQAKKILNCKGQRETSNP